MGSFANDEFGEAIEIDASKRPKPEYDSVADTNSDAAQYKQLAKELKQQRALQAAQGLDLAPPPAPSPGFGGSDANFISNRAQYQDTSYQDDDD